MAVVVNVNEFRKVFIDLGWDNTISMAGFCDWLKASGIDAAGVLAYCNAVKASPNGLDDSTVAATDGHPTSGELPFIEAYLKGTGVLI